MTFNQKIIAAITALLVGITLAVAFVCFSAPYTDNFWIGLSSLVVAQLLFGAFWAVQISKSDSVLPVSLAAWGVNALYLAFTLGATLMAEGMKTRHFMLVEVVAFAVFVIVHLLLRLTEHHVEEMSKGEGEKPAIKKSEVTWR